MPETDCTCRSRSRKASLQSTSRCIHIPPLSGPPSLPVGCTRPSRLMSLRMLSLLSIICPQEA
eukprot:7256552-Prymnesium_polylepis.1